MAYKFQEGTAVLDGQVTSSVGFSGSAISADFFYGSGANITGITATPGGGDTQIQFNDGGSLAGNAAMVFNDSTDAVTFTGALQAGSLKDGTATINGGAGSGFTTFGVTHLSASTGMSGSQIQGAHLVLASGHVTVSTAGLVSGIQLSGSTGLSGSQIQGGHLTLASGRALISNAGAIEGTSFTDDTFTITSGAGSGFTTFGVTQLSASTGISGSQMLGGHLTLGDGRATISNAGAADFAGTLNADGLFVVGNGVRYGSVAVKTAAFALTNANSVIVASGSAAFTLTLPGSPTAGESYVIKRHANMWHDVTIASASANGGASIDGEDTITLEEAGAVNLVYENTTDTWSIF